jgi:hypothetical protein
MYRNRQAAISKRLMVTRWQRITAWHVYRHTSRRGIMIITNRWRTRDFSSISVLTVVDRYKNRPEKPYWNYRNFGRWKTLWEWLEPQNPIPAYAVNCNVIKRAKVGALPILACITGLCTRGQSMKIWKMYKEREETCVLNTILCVMIYRRQNPHATVAV